MNIKNIPAVIWMLSVLGSPLFAQEVLQKNQAVTLAMENNFDIRLADLNVQVAENNSSVQNSGYLPQITGNAGATYSNTRGNATPRQGDATDFTGNQATGLNAGINLNYTIFDGFGRSNTYKQLQENFHITELQARQMVENTILNIFNSYYETDFQSCIFLGR